jgi:hypothetical protein
VFLLTERTKPNVSENRALRRMFERVRKQQNVEGDCISRQSRHMWFVLFARHFEAGMGRACSRHPWEKTEMHTRFWLENLKERDNIKT